MPLFGATPESLVQRNDSKNPASTCRGITGSGRPCRRAIVTTAIIEPYHETDDGVWLYCWQHKDQAGRQPQDNVQSQSSRHQHKPSPSLAKLQTLSERDSLETMVQRLNLHDLSSSPVKHNRHRDPRHTREAGQHQDERDHVNHNRQQVRSKRPKQPGFWASLCCMDQIDDGDYVEIVRHRKRVDRQSTSTHISQPPTNTQQIDHRDFAYLEKPPRRTTPSQDRPNSMGNLLSLIPSQISPQITTALLSELVKPISSTDEDGYIYIFWLTPQIDKPEPRLAQSLLDPSTPNLHSKSRSERRVSDVMTEFSYSGDEPDPTPNHPSLVTRRKTIMLKIGRANNVTRRMHEWQRQCGFAFSLIRWYPHISSSSTASSPFSSPSPGREIKDSVRKVASVKRVERLVHLELSGQQVKKQCTACGREHREWFEVEATQAGIRRVDECIKRWVRWAEDGKQKASTQEYF